MHAQGNTAQRRQPSTGHANPCWNFVSVAGSGVTVLILQLEQGTGHGDDPLATPRDYEYDVESINTLCVRWTPLAKLAASRCFLSILAVYSHAGVRGLIGC
jgi:hypothetical protein